MRVSTRAVFPLVMLGLLLAACGGGNSDIEPVDSTGPGATAEAAASQTPPLATTPSPLPAPTVAPTQGAVRLPQDDAPHPGANTEWWYYNGSLRTADGRDYGFHYVVFTFDFPFFPAAHVSQLSITDHQTSTYATAQRQAQAAARPADANGFSFDIDGWTMTGLDGNDHIVASAGDYSFDLNLSSQKPPVLHGGAGVVGLGPAGDSYYYSRTRMAASGTLTVQGREAPVSGEAWFDHQWGSFIGVALGWDWFSLRLDDGRDVMLYLLRGDDDKRTQGLGTIVAGDGRQETLGESDFTVQATGTWTSPTSGAEYPMGWSLKLPGHGIDIVLRPVITESEFDATSTTRNYYWEGEVLVSGTHTGRGFVELVGYAPLDLSSFDIGP